MVLPGIKPGSPSVRASALKYLTMQNEFRISVVLVFLPILKDLPHESESGNQIKVWRLSRCYDAMTFVLFCWS